MLDLQLTFEPQVVHDLAQLRRCAGREVSTEADSKLNSNGEVSTGFEFGYHFSAQAIPDLWWHGHLPITSRPLWRADP